MNKHSKTTIATYCQQLTDQLLFGAEQTLRWNGITVLLSHGDKTAGSSFGLPQAGREAMQAKEGLHNATPRRGCGWRGSAVRREALQRKKAYS